MTFADLNKVPGVYRIEHVASGRAYIGSTVDLWKRKREHFARLAAGTHPNKILQNAWRKHGPNAFEFTVLERTGADNLLDREQWWIDSYGLVAELYNIQPIAGSSLGQKRSPDTREKLAAANRGRKLSPETVAKRTASRDYRQRPETIAKRAASLRGRIVSPETRARIAAKLKGQPFTAERCANISAGMRRASE